jgi:hypothetical protein
MGKTLADSFRRVSVPKSASSSHDCSFGVQPAVNSTGSAPQMDGNPGEWLPAALFRIAFTAAAPTANSEKAVIWIAANANNGQAMPAATASRQMAAGCMPFAPRNLVATARTVNIVVNATTRYASSNSRPSQVPLPGAVADLVVGTVCNGYVNIQHLREIKINPQVGGAPRSAHRSRRVDGVAVAVSGLDLCATWKRGTAQSVVDETEQEMQRCCTTCKCFGPSSTPADSRHVVAETELAHGLAVGHAKGAGGVPSRESHCRTNNSATTNPVGWVSLRQRVPRGNSRRWRRTSRHPRELRARFSHARELRAQR